MATFSYTAPTVGGSEDTWGNTLNTNWSNLSTFLGSLDSTELAVLDGITATTAELNLLDGVTATTAEINILDGVTATAAELNILDGATVTTAEINILDGVTATASELNALAGFTGSVGYRNVPRASSPSTAYTLQASDVGKYIQVFSGGSITIPNSVFTTGDVVSVYNSTSSDVTVTCSITSAYIAGNDLDKASVTLAPRGVMTILFASTSECVMSGNIS